MEIPELQRQWDRAAPGWARWEESIGMWMQPATTAMLAMANLAEDAQVLDLACGAGNQTLDAARQTGEHGRVVAVDISEAMLEHVREKARAAGFANIMTLASPAEDLDLAEESFDAVICRLGLMLFSDPARALLGVRRALRPGGKVAAVVFTTPDANPFMAKPMQILLRHAAKAPPAAGQPGVFSLGAPGVIERLLSASGFVGIEQRILPVPLRMPSAREALSMMQEAFGAYRAVLSDSPEAVRSAAWAEVATMLESFETEAGFSAPAEVLVAAGQKPDLSHRA